MQQGPVPPSLKPGLNQDCTPIPVVFLLDSQIPIPRWHDRCFLRQGLDIHVEWWNTHFPVSHLSVAPYKGGKNVCIREHCIE